MSYIMIKILIIKVYKMITKYKHVVPCICFAGLIVTIFGCKLGIHITEIENNVNEVSKRLMSEHVIRNYSNRDFNSTVKVFSGSAHRNRSNTKPSSSATLAQKRTTSVKNTLLDNIPSVIDSTKNNIVPRLPDSITKLFLELPKMQYTDKIAILTPIRNSEGTLDQYRLQLGRLTYPHQLLSVYFGEDGSADRSFEKANTTAYRLKIEHMFKEAAVVRLNISGGFNGPYSKRHAENQQRQRRAHMALARNHLLSFALEQDNFDHVLWIDSDVKEFPTDLVQQMLFAKSDVVAASCLMKSGARYYVKYDRNSWRETNASIREQDQGAPDALVLEGYRTTLRIYLPDLRAEGRIVLLDGVGGCALMVKADCFRSGLRFPEVIYKHHIETEGLAKLAIDMGYIVVGLPFVEVFHA